MRPSVATPFFSVIVPVYNIEEYIEECVTSIVAQSERDIEVILVDDGSTDGSGRTCDLQASRDDRVRVVHKQNGGLSTARNAGVEAAKGEYVLFVDGDDYYDDTGFLTDLRSHVVRHGYPDMAVFGRKSLFADSPSYVHDGTVLDEALNPLDVPDLLGSLLSTDSLSISAVLRALRREYLLANRLSFKPALFSEDIEWCLRAYNCSRHVTVLDAKPYVYRRGRSTSITQNIGAKNVRDGIGILEEFARGFDYSSPEMERVLMGYLAYQFCVFCGHLSRLEGADRRECAERLRSLAWLLEHDASPKVRMVRRVHGILGFTLTARTLGWYLRARAR